MSKESLISARDCLAQVCNSCLGDYLIIISNCRHILNQAIKAYKEPDELIKIRLSNILDYICKHTYSHNTSSKVYETIQWLSEDIKHYFTNNLRVDYTTGKYMYNSLAPITWRDIDRKQWDYYVIPELILPETKKVQFTFNQQPQVKDSNVQSNTNTSSSTNTSLASAQHTSYASAQHTNKRTPSSQRRRQSQQQPNPQNKYNNRMSALKAKYGSV